MAKKKIDDEPEPVAAGVDELAPAPVRAPRRVPTGPVLPVNGDYACPRCDAPIARPPLEAWYFGGVLPPDFKDLAAGCGACGWTGLVRVARP